jgi:sec-independent protein translocase protein TatB
MFGISGYEYILIAIVALIVIGPKELPAVLRTIGQWTGKIRRMAAEFQGQFHEAMREAEMADLKKEVDNLNAQAKGITSTFDDPLNASEATKWEYRPDPAPEVASEPKLEASPEVKPESPPEPAAPGGGAVAPPEAAPADRAGADRAGQGAGQASVQEVPVAASEPAAAAMADAVPPASESSAPKAGEGAVHA